MRFSSTITKHGKLSRRSVISFHGMRLPPLLATTALARNRRSAKCGCRTTWHALPLSEATDAIDATSSSKRIYSAIGCGRRLSLPVGARAEVG